MTGVSCLLHESDPISNNGSNIVTYDFHVLQSGAKKAKYQRCVGETCAQFDDDHVRFMPTSVVGSREPCARSKDGYVKLATASEMVM